MKTDYITPETASNQSPTRKNEERLQEKKLPHQNPGKNEGNDYGKGAPEEDNEYLDIDPAGKVGTTPRNGEKEAEPQEPTPQQDEQDFQKETTPATPPQKTRETPQGNPQA